MWNLYNKGKARNTASFSLGEWVFNPKGVLDSLESTVKPTFN
jgi:hypothetical protein